jgi:hypothetical protein
MHLKFLIIYCELIQNNSEMNNLKKQLIRTEIKKI